VVLIAVGVALALILLTAWWVDVHDRKEGRGRKKAAQLGADIRAARRASRATLITRSWLPRIRPDRNSGPTGYVAPDGSRRPVKRGQ
jgi:hypothetical protein